MLKGNLRSCGSWKNIFFYVLRKLKGAELEPVLYWADYTFLLHVNDKFKRLVITHSQELEWSTLPLSAFQNGCSIEHSGALYNVARNTYMAKKATAFFEGFKEKTFYFNNLKSNI